MALPRATVAVSVTGIPVYISNVLLESVICSTDIISFFTVAFFTVTLHLSFLPAILAVIVALPEFFPLTTPFFDTEATFLLLVLHKTLPLAPLAFSFNVSPTVILALLLLSFNVAALTFMFCDAIKVTAIIYIIVNPIFFTFHKHYLCTRLLVPFHIIFL